MIGMRFARGLLLFTLVTVVAEAQAPEPGQPRVPSLESTAQLIGVLPQLTDLRKLSASTAQQDRWQILWLH
jgi:hypothetical protein